MTARESGTDAAPRGPSASDGARHAYEVQADEAGRRLDQFLAGKAFLPTRTRIAALIRSGFATVDGVVRKASHIVAGGEKVEIVLPPEAPSWVEPEPAELTILYEDEHMIAVDKPARMATHPAPGSRRGTLVAALLHRFQLSGDWPDPARPGIVHRLDKDTTGVIVVAKTPAAMHALARQFAQRRVEKRYEAIVMGAPTSAAGVVDLPIGRDPIVRQRMQARVGQTRPARTRYAVSEVLGPAPGFAARVAVEPETGRTHQIRVHLASIGHPVVGDALYGGGRAPAWAAPGARHVLEAPMRQQLHAARLRLRHPGDGRVLEIAAPLPGDMAALLASLRAFDQHRK